MSLSRYRWLFRLVIRLVEAIAMTREGREQREKKREHELPERTEFDPLR